MSDIILDSSLSPNDRLRELPEFLKIEAQVREQRQIEASKKDLSKKALLIARFMGEPIRGTMGYTEYPEDEISEMADESVFHFGWQFDALSYGCNIQVTYYKYNHRITVCYNSDLVYEESSGELTKYLPSEEWELKLDHWSKKARKLKKDSDIVEEQRKEITTSKLLQNMKALLKMTWGV